MKTKFFRLFLGWFLAILPAWAALPAVDLAAPGRTDADLARDATSRPAEIIAFSGAAPGMRIADVFGGSGYYAELLAQVVGEQGRVYLHNNAAYLGFVGKQLEQRLEGDRLSNVVRLDREADDLGFEERSLDGVFLVLAFHDFYFREKDWNVTADQVMPQLRAALKPGGFLLLIDHAALPGSGSAAAQDLHRIDEAFVKSAVQEFGFELVGESQLLRNADDPHTVSVFDPSVRRRTDRFVHLYRRPEQQGS